MKQIETIIKKGNKLVEKETNRKDKIKKALSRQSEAKTFKKWLEATKSYFSTMNDKETEEILRGVLNKFKEFEKSEKVKIDSWKGKSGIKLLEYPDKFIAVTYKKDEKDSEPKEIKKEVLKSDLNNLIVVLNSFEDKEKIKTEDIAEKLYRTEWKKVFADRQKHIYLTYMLNILEQKGKIKYSRRGFTNVIKDLDYFSLK